MDSKTTKTILGVLIAVVLLFATIGFMGSLNSHSNNHSDDGENDIPVTSDKGTVYYDYSMTKEGYILMLTSTETADPGFSFLIVKLTLGNATDSTMKLQTAPFKITDGKETYSYKNSESFYQNYHFTWAPEMKSITSVNLAKDTSYSYYLVYEVPSNGTYTLTADDTYKYHFEFDPTLI